MLNQTNQIKLKGALINDYTLVEKLSENFINEVFYAENNNNKSQRVFFVFKQFNEYLKMAITKIHIQQKESYFENIIRVENCYDFNYQGRELYVVELLKAEQNLSKFYLTLQQKSQAEQKRLKLQIMIRITLGLQELHDNQIIHRDIKPENILMIGERAYIGDLGLSKFLSIDDPPSRINSQGYSAPELYTTGKNYTFSADIYSLGQLFLFILFGVSNIHALIQNNQHNSEIGKLICKMISQDPNKRPTILEILQTLGVPDQQVETQKICYQKK